MAPAALGLAFLHARRALGGARAAIELGALVLYGYALECVAILVFESHTYGATWWVAPAGVPLAVAGVWAAVITSGMALAGRLVPSAAGRAAAAALIGIALDLLMEPVAVRAGLWRWTPPGPWLGVPIGNFVGWGVIVGGYTLGAERFRDSHALARQSAARVALAAVSVGALLVVGLVWTRLGAERAFRGAGGWLVWAVLLAATATLAVRRRPMSRGDTLAGQLAASAGRTPALVFLLLAAVFAADAAALQEGALALAALGSVVTLAIVARASLRSRGAGPREEELT